VYNINKQTMAAVFACIRKRNLPGPWCVPQDELLTGLNCLELLERVGGHRGGSLVGERMVTSSTHCLQ
jgi:hypothetical protein